MIKELYIIIFSFCYKNHISFNSVCEMKDILIRINSNFMVAETIFLLPSFKSHKQVITIRTIFLTHFLFFFDLFSYIISQIFIVKYEGRVIYDVSIQPFPQYMAHSLINSGQSKLLQECLEVLKCFMKTSMTTQVSEVFCWSDNTVLNSIPFSGIEPVFFPLMNDLSENHLEF